MVTLNHPANNSSNWYEGVKDNWDAIETSLLDQNLVTTKGDLIVAPAPSLFGRLGVGSNNQFLMADSTQAAGMRWGTVHTAGQVAVATVRATTTDSTTSTTFVQLNSMTLNVSVTSPQKVLVFFNASFAGTSGVAAVLQLLRGTQALTTAVTGLTTGNGQSMVGSLFCLDQPGTGNFTYSVQWYTSSGTMNQNLSPFSTTAGDRQLTAITIPA